MKRYREIYGVSNVSYYPGPSPYGTVTWYATRSDRDAALDALRETAIDYGLAREAAHSGIYPVRKAIRGEAKSHWLRELIEMGRTRSANGRCHVWRASMGMPEVLDVKLPKKRIFPMQLVPTTKTAPLAKPGEKKQAEPTLIVE